MKKLETERLSSEAFLVSPPDTTVSPKICCAIGETDGDVLLSRTESAAYTRDAVGRGTFEIRRQEGDIKSQWVWGWGDGLGVKRVG